ncbi:MAG: sigma-70 family RNA polymerase sigma factor [Acidimicrobiia bacterium]|nr:MAG: sigma-70 family RNA polymerase sigma factor [Acidimicrobiia bacterium]
MTTANRSETIDKPISRLFGQFADAIYTLGYRIVGDRHLAEDVVQETFMKVMRSLPAYRGEGPIGGWIYRIGYREAITVTRMRREDPIDPTTFTVTSLASGASVEREVLNIELVGRLDDAMHQLSEPVRAAFTLRDIQGLPTSEVASILQVSESAVKMRLARAREALRVQLKEYL